MDEKTEELRDIFMDVAEEGTVTERQAEGRGSLTDVDETAIDDRLADVIAEMRERYAFETDLDSDTYCAIVRGFYEGRDDERLASALDLDAETVFEARMDLHLIGEADADAPFEMATLRGLLRREEDLDTEALAARLDADPATVARFRRVAVAQNAARRTSQRFQTAFEDVLTDADLTVRLTADVQDDGLDEATEDIETNLSF